MFDAPLCYEHINDNFHHNYLSANLIQKTSHINRIILTTQCKKISPMQIDHQFLPPQCCGKTI